MPLCFPGLANIPEMLMQDASWQNRVMMQWLSQSPTADNMDMEIEKMDGDYLAGKPHYFLPAL